MLRTLIIEDSVAFRESLRELLCVNFPAMQVAEASNGDEALAAFVEFVPDVIFMDIRLPGANGLDLTKRIKADNAKVVVIILTSYDLPEYREVALRHGADYFLAKHTPSSDIVRVVERIQSSGVPNVSSPQR